MDSLPAVRHRQNSGGPTAGSAYGIQDGQNQPVAAKKSRANGPAKLLQVTLIGKKTIVWKRLFGTGLGNAAGIAERVFQHDENAAVFKAAAFRLIPAAFAVGNLGAAGSIPDL
jgi:hypothetical protein